MKGGFNRAQMKGAIAVAGLLKSRKIVLLPKPGSPSKRYEISLGDAYFEPKYGARNGNTTMNVNGAHINIKNFDVYVETTEGSLMKIEGNESAMSRLEELTEKVLKEGETIINQASLEGGASSQALALLPQAKNDLSGEGSDEVSMPESIASPDTTYTASVKLGVGLTDAFLKMNPIASELTTALDQLVVYKDPGGDAEPTEVATQFICKKPYNSENATAKDRIESCVKGVPAEGESTYANRQQCVSNCYNK